MAKFSRPNLSPKEVDQLQRILSSHRAAVNDLQAVASQYGEDEDFEDLPPADQRAVVDANSRIDSAHRQINDLLSRLSERDFASPDEPLKHLGAPHMILVDFYWETGPRLPISGPKHTNELPSWTFFDQEVGAFHPADEILLPQSDDPAELESLTWYEPDSLVSELQDVVERGGTVPVFDHQRQNLLELARQADEGAEYFEALADPRGAPEDMPGLEAQVWPAKKRQRVAQLIDDFEQVRRKAIAQHGEAYAAYNREHPDDEGGYEEEEDPVLMGYVHELQDLAQRIWDEILTHFDEADRAALANYLYEPESRQLFPWLSLEEIPEQILDGLDDWPFQWDDLYLTEAISGHPADVLEYPDQELRALRKGLQYAVPPLKAAARRKALKIADEMRSVAAHARELAAT